MALSASEHIRRDTRDIATLIAENAHAYNPVFTKGLTQVMLGAPQSVYNGGLLRATVRYFDPDRRRPGLPQDVAALVDTLASDSAAIQFVNLSTTDTRRLIVGAGAFGEHQFTDARFKEVNLEALEKNPYTWIREEKQQVDRIAPINGKYFAVELPPATSIRVVTGMRRFANQPSYAFPWHGGGIPVPFQ